PNRIVESRRETIGLDLHCRELRAKRGKRLTERDAEMLEFRCFEMVDCRGDGGSNETQRHSRLPEVEYGEGDLKHGLETGNLRGEAQVRRDDAVVEMHG